MAGFLQRRLGPQRDLGPSRRLSVNEKLTGHRMDRQVRCLSLAAADQSDCQRQQPRGAAASSENVADVLHCVLAVDCREKMNQCR